MFDIKECAICYNDMGGRKVFVIGEFHICYKERRMDSDGHEDALQLVCCKVDSHYVKRRRER